MASTLTASDVIDGATTETGLSDLGGEHVTTAIETAVAGLAGGQFDEAIVAGALEQLHQMLVTRLRYVEDRRLYPIDQERIEAPFIIIGPARAGTTLVHELLALDPDARGVRFWEMHEPSPPPGLGAGDDDRIGRAGDALRGWIATVPEIMAMHPYFDDGGRSLMEDDAILILEFQGGQPMSTYKVPVPFLPTPEPLTFYESHRRVLQHLQYGAPDRRWALKGTYHTNRVAVIRSIYPDARIIWNHRDPFRVFPSIMQILAVVQGDPDGERIDLKALAPMVLANWGQPIKEAMNDPATNDGQVFHLHYSELMDDQAAMIARIYDHFGLPFDAAYAARIRGWLTDPANRPDRHGRVEFTPEKFGLTSAQIADEFAEYVDRYGIRKEGR